ncbi:U2-associated [Hyphodiscus hymeniophilus]|uniref:U2-associated n=1 Tax=Hyphodiscus hymeniophilus TaxID=353542 RepID=A0A9P7AXN3_9HELO|nr:U2-associated [Hyphodiscus hymeniophilus]
MASSNKKIDQFPDVTSKLKAPTKKSLFERQKAEAEAKRLREEAETKAAYDDFVKSFDDEDENTFGGGLPPPRRSFGGQGMGMGIPPSGPASGRGFGGGFGGGTGGYGGRGVGMGSGPGSLGPPPNKSRGFESFSQPQRREDRGLLAFDDYEGASPSRVLKTDEDEDDRGRTRDVEEQKAAAKPTLQLASLPPGTSPAVIKALLPATLTVDAVRILPPSGPTVYTERKSMSAIVTLAKDTPANDIDAAVNGLQNRYLGYGHYLNLHRHLSSAAIASSAAIPTLGLATASQPFGAKAVALPGTGRGHAPPAHHQRGFAPPSSYAPSGMGQIPRGGPLLHVPVQPPSDVKQLKLIHKVIELLLTHGPEFEALLMSRADVQREEKWAWLWDSRSVGGVWYRWRLWEVLTGSQTKKGKGKYLPLFEGSSAWKEPDQPLIFEYTTRIDEFVSDTEYASSDEDDSGDEGARRPGGGLAADTSSLMDDGKAYLNPLEKAKLTHLLSRMPTSNGKLRKGDVARVTAFAISHAGRGADEVVAMIISNVEKPFAYTSANPDRKKDEGNGDDAADLNENDEKEDMSSASLIGIYIISDILSSSSTSGVRHAWRYRQLFETVLKQRKVFEGLGRMERTMSWGRLRAEKWKRSVQNMLSLWEGWCVFPAESQEHFVQVFNNPPLTIQQERDAREKESATQDKGKSKWKAVEVAPKEHAQTKDVDTPMSEDAMDDLDGEPMDEDVDGEPMDEDVDGFPMDEEDENGLDGEPMQAPNELSLPTSPDPPPRMAEPDTSNIPSKVDNASVPQARRARPKAVDMFADSDEDN